MCTICKETYSEVIYASEAYHQYGKAKVVAGQNVYECGVCHYLRKEQIDCEHSYDEIENLATCTEPGLKTSLCSKCKDVKVEMAEATGHTLDLDPKTMLSSTRITVEKTCTTPGEATGICTTCKKSIVKVIPASHDYYTAVEKAATCEEDGLISRICMKDCNLPDSNVLEVVPARGHAEPTDADEIRYYQATAVKDSETGEVIKYDYTPETYTTKDDEQVVDVANDLLEDFYKMTPSEINAILCNYDIIKVYSCQNEDVDDDNFKFDAKKEHGENNEVEVLFYESVGHKYIVTVDPTCTQEGTKICSVCGDGEEGNIPFLGHDFYGRSLGSQNESICKRCGETVKVTVEAINDAPKFADKDTKDEREIAVNERMAKVTVTNEADNVVRIKQNEKFDEKINAQNKDAYCFCVIVKLSIKAADVEVASGNYTINDADRICAKQWSDKVDDADEYSFIVWLSPLDFAADGTYSISFRDASDYNSYPVTVTFVYDTTSVTK